MNLDTLYISDLDGTLLDSNSQVNPISAEIISNLTADGASFTIATARTPATVIPLLSQTATAPLLIVMTGAALFNRETLEFVDPLLMPAEAYSLASDIIERNGLGPFCYFLNNSNQHLNVYHRYEMSPEENAFYLQRRNLKLKSFHLGQNPPEDEANRCMLIFATGPTDKITAIAQQLSADNRFSVSAYPDIFNHDISLIEIFTSGVSKAARVEELRKTYKKNRTVVFGDNLNDLPMMQVANLAVAVENANPEVSKKADIVVGTNNSNAVAHFIEKDFYKPA